MKRMKQTLSVLLAALMIVLSVPVAVGATSDVVISGTCGENGDNITWSLTEDRVLTVSGSGEVPSGFLHEIGNMLETLHDTELVKASAYP